MGKPLELVAESDWTEEGFGEREHEGWGFGKRPRLWKYTQNHDAGNWLGKSVVESDDVEEMATAQRAGTSAGQGSPMPAFSWLNSANEGFYHAVSYHIARDLEALVKAAKGYTFTVSAGTLYIVFDGKTVPDWIPALNRVVSHDTQVAEYVREHGLEKTTKLLKDLVESVLPVGSGVTFTVEADGESDDEWLIANVRVKADRKDAYDMFDKLVDAWLDSTNPAARKRIRLTYTAG